ncbi:MAG: hypothetical protein AAGA92_11450 [Planctomycetota bacterium]
MIETEDFNSIVTDTRIDGVPAPLNNMTVSGQSALGDPDLTLIEAPPFDGNDFYQFDGTSFLVTIINSNRGDFLRFDFDTPVTAWGAETIGVSNEGRRTSILVFDANDTLLGRIDPLAPKPQSGNFFSDFRSFYGFSLDSSAASYVLWESTTAGDAFGVDDIAFVAVPEPAAAGLAATVLAMLSRFQRSRI